MDYTIAAAISPEWTPIDKPVQLNDVCAVISLDQEFLCGHILPYEQFEYLYFGGLDSDDILFAIQTIVNNQNYIKILDKKPEKIFALHLFKKARQNES